MQEIPINFRCPQCNHDELTEVQSNVTTQHLVRKMVIADSTPGTKRVGKKFCIMHEFQGVTGGNVEMFKCNACGYVLRGEPRWGQEGAVINNAKNLHSWLKRNNMMPTTGG